MAHILQKLLNAEALREALLSVMSDSIHHVQTEPELSSIFALFVMAGFPEVRSFTYLSQCNVTSQILCVSVRKGKFFLP